MTATLPASGETAVTFDFGSAAVPSGHTVAFVQTLVSGPGTSLFFDTGTCGLGDLTCTTCPGVIETEGTTPPLDTFRRGSAGLSITAGAATATIPTLGTIGLVLMGLAICAAALLLVRRLTT